VGAAAAAAAATAVAQQYYATAAAADAVDWITCTWITRRCSCKP